jgi:hypothetical protein
VYVIWRKVRSSPLLTQSMGKHKCMQLLPSKELPEVTNSIFPTGVAAEFIDPVPGTGTGISKVLSKSTSATHRPEPADVLRFL